MAFQIPPPILYTPEEVQSSINSIPKTFLKPKKKKDIGNYRYSTPAMYGTNPMFGTSTQIATTPEARKEDAALLSAIGNTIGHYIPVIGPYISAASSIPDVMYDVMDLAKNPNYVNTGHILLDGINRATKFTRTPFDDIVSGLGVVDDLHQSQGVDILDWIDKTFQPKSKTKSKKK